MLRDPRYTWARQLAALAVLLAVWELAGRAGMLNPLYVPAPSKIGAVLVELFADGRIWPHLNATFSVLEQIVIPDELVAVVRLERPQLWQCRVFSPLLLRPLSFVDPLQLFADTQIHAAVENPIGFLLFADLKPRIGALCPQLFRRAHFEIRRNQGRLLVCSP